MSASRRPNMRANRARILAGFALTGAIGAAAVLPSFVGDGHLTVIRGISATPPVAHTVVHVAPSVQLFPPARHSVTVSHAPAHFTLAAPLAQLASARRSTPASAFVRTASPASGRPARRPAPK